MNRLIKMAVCTVGWEAHLQMDVGQEGGAVLVHTLQQPGEDRIHQIVSPRRPEKKGHARADSHPQREL